MVFLSLQFSATTNSNSSGSKPRKKKANRNTNSASHDAWNRETGEPNQRWINSVDVSVLYRNVGNVDKDEYKQLPNVCKKYFREHPQVEMPGKFKDQQKPVPKNKKKK